MGVKGDERRRGSCFRSESRPPTAAPRRAKKRHVIRVTRSYQTARVSPLFDHSFSAMEQITTSLAARAAPKSTVSGSASDVAGSVTKRFFFSDFNYNSLISFWQTEQ